MTTRPDFLSQRPDLLEPQDPRGDALADVLGASLLRNVVYRRIEATAPWGLRIPAHERATFYVIARGAARLELGDEVHALAAGDVVFLPHGTPHIVRDAPRSKPIAVCAGKVDQGGCGPGSGPRRIGGGGALTSIITGFFPLSGGRKPVLLETMPEIIALSPGDANFPPWIGATVQLLIAESSASGPASALVMQRLADVLLVQVLRVTANAKPCDGARGLRALGDPAIHDALNLLHGRVAAPWTVARLASSVGLSRSAFAARFTELVGEPPLQYLARWRMARAAELLRDTTDGIAQIAGKVGYDSVPSFTKAFKRWQGLSPGTFRRRQAGALAASAR
jgi:AraC-like DNA-binding protein